MIREKIILPMVVLLAATGCAAQSLHHGLTACYPLDSHAQDAVNALHGTIHAATGTTGHTNIGATAMKFSGQVTSYIDLPNSPLIKPADTICVSGWYRADQLAWAELIFAKNIHSSYYSAYNLTIRNIQSGPFQFVAIRQNGAGDDSVKTVSGIQPNTWYHVVFSIGPDSMKVYLNGVKEGSIPCSIHQFNYDPQRGVILGGTNETAWNLPFSGAMDNLRFYNRELTAQEIQLLYQEDPLCIAEPTAIADNKEDGSIRVYPMPFERTFIVETPARKGMMTIKDLQGRVVLEQFLTDPKIEIDATPLEPGVYFLEVGGHYHRLLKL